MPDGYFADGYWASDYFASGYWGTAPATVTPTATAGSYATIQRKKRLPDPTDDATALILMIQRRRRN